MGLMDKDENIQESQTALTSLRSTATTFATQWSQIPTDQQRRIESDLPEVSQNLLKGFDDSSVIESQPMHRSLSSVSGMPAPVQTALSHVLHAVDFAERDESLMRKSKFTKACTSALESFSRWLTDSGFPTSAAASATARQGTSTRQGSGYSTPPSDRI
jgi:hypothetical protein